MATPLQQGIAFAVYLVVAGSTVIVPVLAYQLFSERIVEPLNALNGWLIRHNSAVVSAIMLIFGVLILVSGLDVLVG